jgi:hypothetical protein
VGEREEIRSTFSMTGGVIIGEGAGAGGGKPGPRDEWRRSARSQDREWYAVEENVVYATRALWR